MLILDLMAYNARMALILRFVTVGVNEPFFFVEMDSKVFYFFCIVQTMAIYGEYVFFLLGTFCECDTFSFLVVNLEFPLREVSADDIQSPLQSIL